ncbi:4Fe-4S dicluster domain-containing protein [Methanoplanus sp. FWC-SCC4]|uniref:4Fe-4S dicluster domain-containing protein n=1 Tax=Methanochimaera problematica TaxID=2609417 RepID=A0AA97FD91_9EURY|nr:4Fe-4S dicluster domain-containing protein [Methanoplanus sp. FWC-SCC4]WOF16737.1 4Fe-4S dicluster domain-containing protein [Methanoplanus sp. FWC-SCC4]
MSTKKSGILKSNEKFYRTIRIRCPAGYLDSDALGKISELSKKYGNGEVCLTSRLSVEIPYVNVEYADDAKAEIEDAGLVVGGTGPVVRAVFACKGTFCPHGIVDTRKIASEIEEKYGGMKLPVKIKTGVSGCPNNCGKAQFNDIGFIAYSVPEVAGDSCNECGKCVSACKEDAVSLEDSVVSVNYERCISCGDCITACKKENIISKESGVRVYLGGRAGRRLIFGKEYKRPLKEENCIKVAGLVIDYVKENGREGVRLGQLILDDGFEKLEKYLDDNLSF